MEGSASVIKPIVFFAMSIARRQLEAGVPEQYGQDFVSLRGEHKAVAMLALDQVSHEQVSDRRNRHHDGQDRCVAPCHGLAQVPARCGCPRLVSVALANWHDQYRTDVFLMTVAELKAKCDEYK